MTYAIANSNGIIVSIVDTEEEAIKILFSITNGVIWKRPEGAKQSMIYALLNGDLYRMEIIND